MASINNAQATTTVTVTPPFTITLTPNPMTIALGTATTQNLTITFNQPVACHDGGASLSIGEPGAFATVRRRRVTFSAGADHGHSP